MTKIISNIILATIPEFPLIVQWNDKGESEIFVSNVANYKRENCRYLMFLSFGYRRSLEVAELNSIIENVTAIISKKKNAFVILTERKLPPNDYIRYDEFVHSYACEHIFFSGVESKIKKPIIGLSLFEILEAILLGKADIDKIFVRQIPFKTNLLERRTRMDVVVPHSGNLLFLRQLLKFVQQLDGVLPFIAFDDKVTPETMDICVNYNFTRFFDTNIKGVGPYILRNLLIQKTTTPIFAFQDSDDIPTYDRFQTLAEYQNSRGPEMLGSYELRMDYYTKKVQAIRYPLNITSLQFMPCHSLLHPTACLTRDGYNVSGPLSENLKFASDTQYLLRSFFLLKDISNIDEFLYIKRVHEGSLTTSYHTRLGSKKRNDLIKSWFKEFNKVKNGEIALRESALTFIKNDPISNQCHLIHLN